MISVFSFYCSSNSGAQDSNVKLHSIRLDGRPLVIDEDLTSNQLLEDGEPSLSNTQMCRTTLLRVPSRALSEGFTLLGTVDLDTDSRSSASSLFPYIEIQIGGIHILTGNYGGNKVGTPSAAN